MVNLMRMDWKRLQKSKSTYIIIGVMVLILFIQFLTVYVALNPDIQSWLNERGIIFQVSGMDKLSALSLLDFFHISMTQNFFAMVIGVFVILFNCYEVETGFIKNVFSVHVNKVHYICSKMIIQSLYVLGFLVICMIEFLILNMMLGFFFPVNAFMEWLTYGLLLWICGIAIITMMSALSIWLKSKSGCIAVVIVYATGLWIMVATTILSVIGYADLWNYTLLNQTAGLLDLMSVLDIYAVLQFLLLMGGFIVFYTILSLYGLKKRDI